MIGRLGPASAAALLIATPALAQSAMPDMPGMSHGQPAPAAAPMADMPGMQMPMHRMTGALGNYAMAREASGTAWQPDASALDGLHIMRGDWMVMVHADLNLVYDWQGGPRGASKSFAAGMLMGMAKRSFASGDMLQFKAMLSPDPFMGPNGYPLLLATGETANGVTPLVDRQHPHDLFMELSTSYAHKLSGADSVFLYAGLPGEPAFGPPAFMHRQSIMDSPEAPISHHWLDSTHITFGVLTAGYVHDNWKVEVSRFKGREPDQHRYNIETPKLDSTALRLSWNPASDWSLQASWADVKSPEQLEPQLNQKRWSASAIYTRPLGDAGWWSTTAAYGRRTSPHGDLPAWVLESAIKPTAPWTVFGRAEQVNNDELVIAGPLSGRVFTVSKVSLGAIHDWRVSDHLKLGLGGLYAWNFVPAALKAAYGGDPHGAMAFLRLKLD
ncbi:MAG: hypothetical protein JWP49_1314 [Phenylobacterium sp.]|nr:hypothetical protein [Phenylobacterium sp.]